jgi:hypothetical protein
MNEPCDLLARAPQHQAMDGLERRPAGSAHLAVDEQGQERRSTSSLVRKACIGLLGVGQSAPGQHMCRLRVSPQHTQARSWGRVEPGTQESTQPSLIGFICASLRVTLV